MIQSRAPTYSHFFSESKCIYMGRHPHVEEQVRYICSNTYTAYSQVRIKNGAMSEGKTPLKITPKSITIISKWESRTDSGSYLTLLTSDELCK